MNLQEVKARLEENNFTVQIFETKEEAADYLDRAIDGKTVGMGGSLTLTELDVSSVSGTVSVHAANAGEISLETTSGAITGSVKQRHVIDQDTCIKCGKCMDSCKFGAIVKD